MDKVFTPILAQYGLTMMQARILTEIKDCGHHTVGSLGSVIGIASGNTSSMCKKLEKAGFIKRIRDPEDERFVKLALTDFGEQTLQKIENTLDEKYGDFLRSNSEQFCAIAIGMSKLCSFIKEMSEL
jgi:DNA-binding MarR family transcriptional regulator